MAQLDFHGKAVVSAWLERLRKEPGTGFQRSGDEANLLIHADNIMALQALLNHDRRFDAIYIDPPYNTGLRIGQHGFHYHDDSASPELMAWFKHIGLHTKEGSRHDRWLCMIWPRLVLAQQLLTEDGVFFISIGNNELAHLKLLMDEIFGEDNFLELFVWEKTQHFGRQALNSYSNGEYVLAYARNLFTARGQRKRLLVERVQQQLQDAPLYNASNPLNRLEFPPHSVQMDLPDGRYQQCEHAHYQLLEPVDVRSGLNETALILRFRSRWSPERLAEEQRQGCRFWIRSPRFAIRVIYPEHRSTRVSPRQLMFSNRNHPLHTRSRFNIRVGTSEEGSSALLTAGLKFSYPKPASLIAYLLSLLWAPEQDDFRNHLHVLDFFAGSGSTGAAAGLLNQHGMQVQYVLVEQDAQTFALAEQRLAKASCASIHLSAPWSTT